MRQFIIAATVFFISSLNAFGQDHITVRIIESQYEESARIIIVDHDGKSKIIPLRDYYRPSNIDSLFIENQNTINETIDSISKNGFELIGTISNGDKTIHSIMIFRKEEFKE